MVEKVNNEKDFFMVVKEMQENADKAVFSHHAMPCTELVEQLRKELKSNE